MAGYSCPLPWPLLGLPLCLLKPCYADPRSLPALSDGYHHLVNIGAFCSQGTQDWLSEPCAALCRLIFPNSGPSRETTLMIHASLSALKYGLLNCTL